MSGKIKLVRPFFPMIGGEKCHDKAIIAGKIQRKNPWT
jgi:hypothetical protein